MDVSNLHARMTEDLKTVRLDFHITWIAISVKSALPKLVESFGVEILIQDVGNRLPPLV